MATTHLIPMHKIKNQSIAYTVHERIDTRHKYRNFLGSSFALRRASDRLCLENGLSIVENPQKSNTHYGKWLGDKKKLSFQDICKKTDELTARFHELSDQIKASEARMAEIAVMQKHIINYAKTREIYVAYRKAGYSTF